MVALFEKQKKEEGILEKANKTIVPVLVAITTLAALFSSQDVWVKYPAIVISGLLVLVVAYSPILLAAKQIKNRFFPRKLTGEQRIRLEMLIQDSPAHTSDSHCYSVFYKWTSLAQTLGLTNYNRREHDVIRHQLSDMYDFMERFPKHEVYMLGKLSRVIQSVADAAASVQRELSSEVSRDGVEERIRKQVRADWSECISSFNLWLKEWEKLFKEANRFIGANCPNYIQLVRQLD